MKIALSDLKKAVQWVEGHSQDLMVDVYISDRNLVVTCSDRLGPSVEIKLAEEGLRMAKIKKEDNL